MKSIIKKLNLMFAGILLAANLVAVPVSAQSTTKNSVCEGIGAATGSANGCADPVGEPTVGSTVQTVVNILSLIVGVVAVIMIIIGGLKYVTSSGDSNNITSAKNTIIYALIGLVIVALSQIIVRFVLDTVG